jgi:hypothetical protein
MTQNNIGRTTRIRKVTAYSRFYLAAGLILLLALLASVGATELPTQKTRRQPARDPYDCPIGSGPTLTIRFYGLFYFSFPDVRGTPNRREKGIVGILSTRKDHSLYVKVGSSIFAIPHETLQNQASEIEIDRDGRTGDDVTIRGCTVSTGWDERLKGMRMDRSDHPDYFNWIIDVENSEMHHRNLSEERDALKPKLVFKTGCFGTYRLTDYKYYTLQNGDFAEFGYVAAKMEVVIVRASSTEKIWMMWRGGARTVIPSDITEIELYNVRPEDLNDILNYELRRSTAMRSRKTAPMAMANVNMPHSDDFHIYYDDLLRGPSSQEKFYFIPDLSGLLKRGEYHMVSVPFICYGVGGSK